MPGQPITVEIEGLRELSRALKVADNELAKELRKAMNVAAQLVIDDARPKVPTRSGRAAGSLRVASTRTLVRVSGGSSRAPYYPWLDFGGSVGRNNSVVRQFRKRGRYLYLSFFQLRDSGKFTAVLEESIRDVVRRAGLPDGGVG